MAIMRQGFYKLTGVVLKRYETNEGDIRLYNLFRDFGPQWILAPGAARGRRRFGGATEPLIWGHFGCYKSPKQLYLRDIEVKEDHWKIRSNPDKLEKAMVWTNLLTKYLLPLQPCNEVMAIFYDSLCLLERDIDESMIEWRFLYRWMKRWGLAPELIRCASCGKEVTTAYWDGDVVFCEECRSNKDELIIPKEELREMVFAFALPRESLVRWIQRVEPRANYVVYNRKLRDILRLSLA